MTTNLLKKTIGVAMGIMLFSFAPLNAAQDKPADNMQILRDKIKADKKLLVATNMELTETEAKGFWPIYEQYQKEQDAIVNGQITATQAYADRFATLSDADALNYVNALLERDGKMHDLRVKWLAKFQTVVPAKIAARAIQLDRRVSQVMQVKVASQIPLIP